MQRYKMPPHHGWRCKPGYKIFVANQSEVRFDVPAEWVIKMAGGKCDVEVRDRKWPKDDCCVQLSVFDHPPGIDWAVLPLTQLARSERGDPPDTLRRGEDHHEKRPGAELIWHESASLEKREKREARSRQRAAREPQSHAIITMSCWPEHAHRFGPVWDEVMRSLTLGVYIRNPLPGE